MYFNNRKTENKHITKIKASKQAEHLPLTLVLHATVLQLTVPYYIFFVLFYLTTKQPPSEARQYYRNDANPYCVLLTFCVIVILNVISGIKMQCVTGTLHECTILT